MTKAKTRPVGRPRVGKDVMGLIAIRMPEDMLEAVDKIIADRYGQGDRSTVIRELVAEALHARATPRRGKA